MRRVLPESMILVSMLALGCFMMACGERAANAPSATTPPPVAMDAPSEDVPTVTAPAMGAMPAPGTIRFAGFGLASFGADEEQVRMAWGGDLGDARPPEPGGCYYLIPQPPQERGYRVGFMFEGGRFVRVDIDAADIEAPGGGRVGMSAQQIRRLYAGRVEERPHKYLQGGHYLRIGDVDGGKGVLLFETGKEGQVKSWRVGLPPQIDYVEGCS
jgi:hypothetical protein